MDLDLEITLWANAIPEIRLDDVERLAKHFFELGQNHAWSEDDEMIALNIEQVMNCASLLNIVPEKIDKIRTWLKSLKERI